MYASNRMPLPFTVLKQYIRSEYWDTFCFSGSNEHKNDAHTHREVTNVIEVRNKLISFIMVSIIITSIISNKKRKHEFMGIDKNDNSCRNFNIPEMETLI